MGYLPMQGLKAGLSAGRKSPSDGDAGRTAARGGIDGSKSQKTCAFSVA